MRRVMLWAICSSVSWAPAAAQAQLYTGGPIQAPCLTLSDCLQKGYKFTSVSERSGSNEKGEQIIFRTFWF